MTLIDDLDGHLAAIKTGVVRAGQIAAGAENGSAEISSYVAVRGWTGIAQAMTRVRAGIGEVRARITALGESVREARRPVATVAKQVTPQQAIDALAPIETALQAIQTGIGVTVARLGEVQRAAAATLQGGRPGPLLARLEGVRTVLTAVGQHCTSAAADVAAAVVVAQRAGAVDRSGGDRPADEVLNDEPSTFHPRFLDGLPTRAGVRDPTVGVLTTVDGKKINDVKSGHDGPGAGGPQLKFPWSNTYTAVDHADGHAAAIMRTRRIRNATLYLNNPPCEGLAGRDNCCPRSCGRATN